MVNTASETVFENGKFVKKPLVTETNVDKGNRLFTDGNGNSFVANMNNDYVKEAVNNGTPIYTNSNGDWIGQSELDNYISSLSSPEISLKFNENSGGIDVSAPQDILNSNEFKDVMKEIRSSAVNIDLKNPEQLKSYLDQATQIANDVASSVGQYAAAKLAVQQDAIKNGLNFTPSDSDIALAFLADGSVNGKDNKNVSTGLIKKDGKWVAQWAEEGDSEESNNKILSEMYKNWFGIVKDELSYNDKIKLADAMSNVASADLSEYKQNNVMSKEDLYRQKISAQAQLRWLQDKKLLEGNAADKAFDVLAGTALGLREGVLFAKPISNLLMGKEDNEKTEEYLEARANMQGSLINNARLGGDLLSLVGDIIATGATGGMASPRLAASGVRLAAFAARHADDAPRIANLAKTASQGLSDAARARGLLETANDAKKLEKLAVATGDAEKIAKASTNAANAVKALNEINAIQRFGTRVNRTLGLTDNLKFGAIYSAVKASNELDEGYTLSDFAIDTGFNAALFGAGRLVSKIGDAIPMATRAKVSQQFAKATTKASEAPVISSFKNFFQSSGDKFNKMRQEAKQAFVESDGSLASYYDWRSTAGKAAQMQNRTAFIARELKNDADAEKIRRLTKKIGGSDRTIHGSINTGKIRNGSSVVKNGKLYSQIGRESRLRLNARIVLETAERQLESFKRKARLSKSDTEKIEKITATRDRMRELADAMTDDEKELWTLLSNTLKDGRDVARKYGVSDKELDALLDSTSLGKTDYIPMYTADSILENKYFSKQKVDANTLKSKEVTDHRRDAVYNIEERLDNYIDPVTATFMKLDKYMSKIEDAVVRRSVAESQVTRKAAVAVDEGALQTVREIRSNPSKDPQINSTILREKIAASALGKQNHIKDWFDNMDDLTPKQRVDMANDFMDSFIDSDLYKRMETVEEITQGEFERELIKTYQMQYSYDAAQRFADKVSYGDLPEDIKYSIDLEIKNNHGNPKGDELDKLREDKSIIANAVWLRNDKVRVAIADGVFDPNTKLDSKEAARRIAAFSPSKAVKKPVKEIEKGLKKDFDLNKTLELAGISGDGLPKDFRRISYVKEKDIDALIDRLSIEATTPADLAMAIDSVVNIMLDNAAFTMLSPDRIVKIKNFAYENGIKSNFNAARVMIAANQLDNLTGVIRTKLKKLNNAPGASKEFAKLLSDDAYIADLIDHAIVANEGMDNLLPEVREQIANIYAETARVAEADRMVKEFGIADNFMSARRANTISYEDPSIPVGDPSRVIHTVTPDRATAQMVNNPGLHREDKFGKAAEPLMNLMRATSFMYRLGTTGTNPVAITRNFVRDNIHGFLTTGNTPFVDKNSLLFTGWKDYIYNMTGDKKIAEEADRVIKEAAMSNTETKQLFSTNVTLENGMLVKGVKKVVNFVQTPAQKVEQITRENIGRQSYAKWLKETGDHNLALDLALGDMVEGVTNFGNNIGALNKIAYAAPYLSAAINGTTSFARMFAYDPAGMAARIFSSVIVPITILTANNLSTEDKRKIYENIPEWAKEQSAFFIGDDGQVIMVPLPQELYGLTNVIRLTMQNYANTNPVDWKFLVQQGLFGSSPLDIDIFDESGDADPWRAIARFGSSFTPQIAKTAYEYATGQDLYFGGDLYGTNKSSPTINAIADFFNPDGFLTQDEASEANAKIYQTLENLFGTNVRSIIYYADMMLGAREDERGGKSLTRQFARAFAGDGYNQAEYDWSSTKKDLNERKKELQNELARIDAQVGAGKMSQEQGDAAKMNIRDAFSNEVKNAFEKWGNYYQANGGMTPKIQKDIINILNMSSMGSPFTSTEYGQDTIDQAFFAGRELAQNEYLATGLEDTFGGMSYNADNDDMEIRNNLAQQVRDSQSKGSTAKQVVYQFNELVDNQKLSNGMTLKENYSLIQDAIAKEKAAAKKENRKADYTEINKMEEEYMKEYDKIARAVLNTYGKDVLNNKTVVDALEKKAFWDYNDWGVGYATSKKGKVYQQKLNTKTFKHATANAKTLLLERYKDVPNMPTVSSADVSDEIYRIKQIMRTDINKAKLRAERMLQRINNGSSVATQADKQYLINVVK